MCALNREEKTEEGREEGEEKEGEKGSSPEKKNTSKEKGLLFHDLQYLLKRWH